MSNFKCLRQRRISLRLKILKNWISITDNWKLETGNRKLASGFTLVELIVTVTIFASLLIFTTLNVVNVKQRTSLQTTIEILIGDLRQQQLKAMVGDTEGRLIRDDYGVHFNQTSYILFHGGTYSPAGTALFTVSLGDNVQVVSGNDIIFSRNSGESVGGATNIVLRENTTRIQKTIYLNQYGVVTAVN